MLGRTWYLSGDSCSGLLGTACPSEPGGEALAPRARNVGPVLTVRRAGEGARFYLASPLGLASDKGEKTPSKECTFQLNRPAPDLLVSIVRDGIPNGLDVPGVAMPERVFLSVHKQPGKNGEDTPVHLWLLEIILKEERGAKLSNPQCVRDGQ